MTTDERLDKMEQRLDRVEQRLDRLETVVTELKANVGFINIALRTVATRDDLQAMERRLTALEHAR